MKTSYFLLTMVSLIGEIKMKMIGAILLATLTAAASAQNIQFGQVSDSSYTAIAAKDVSVVLLVEVREVNPNVATAVYCTTPGCNTVYMDVQKLIPFKSAADAVQYLNDNKAAKLIRLMSVKDVSVKVETNTETVAQPPQAKITTTYKLPK